MTPQLHEAILKVIQEILGILVTLATGFLLTYLKKKIGTENASRIQAVLTNKMTLSEMAVNIVKIRVPDADPKDKFLQACNALSRFLKEHNIEVTDQEIMDLVTQTIQSSQQALYTPGLNGTKYPKGTLVAGVAQQATPEFDVNAVYESVS